VRAGTVTLPLNTLLNAEQYAYILGDSRAAALVASASLAKTLVPVLDRLPRAARTRRALAVSVRRRCA
jgi:4-hydroxybenzoate-CoA ligase